MIVLLATILILIRETGGAGEGVEEVEIEIPSMSVLV
jgi:hypothetical protein